MDPIIKCLCAFQLFYFVDTSAFSNFRQTDIFQEILDDGLITTDTDVPLVTCSKSCFRDVNCRRFKWCEDDVTSGQCYTYEDGQSCPHQVSGQQCYCFQKVLSYEDGEYMCPIGYYGNKCDKVIKHCSEGSLHGLDSLGKKLSFIQPDGAAEPFEVFCEFRYGGLTIVQSRNINATHVDFNRTMADYINGFGHPGYNHWLGLKRISLISKKSATKCNVQLNDEDGFCKVYYDDFHVYGQDDNYKLHLSDYSTSVSPKCGDSLLSSDSIHGAPFSTFDADNNNGCAAKMAAGWWYAQTATCTKGNLNAPLVTSAEVAGDPAIRRIKWEKDRRDNVIDQSFIRIMRTDV